MVMIDLYDLFIWRQFSAGDSNPLGNIDDIYWLLGICVAGAVAWEYISRLGVLFYGVGCDTRQLR